MPIVSQIALEVWRASGRRTISRLRELVRLYAETRAGEIDRLDTLESAAIAGTHSWEIEAE